MGRSELIHRISDYETEWANTDEYIKEIALDVFGANTVDDVIYPVRLDEADEATVEDVHYLWKDLMGVVAHKEHELGYFD